MTIESRSRRAAAAPVPARPRTRAMVIPSSPEPTIARTRTRASTTEPLPPPDTAFDQRNDMGTATVTTTHRDASIGQETVFTDEIQRFPVALPPGIPHVAHVRVGGGVTIQPRQYEAIRCDVSLTMPCAPTPEAVEEQYRATSAWVEDKITEQLDLAARGTANR